MMTQLASIYAIVEEGRNSDSIKDYTYNAAVEEHELLQALVGEKINLSPLPSGMIPLFQRGFFPWGSFPYPIEHAQLGTVLGQLGDEPSRQLAQAMAPFHQAALDHRLQPMRSFLMQERARADLKKVSDDFFQAVALEPMSESLFLDHTFGIYSRRTPHSTLVCLASGCKSGMGAFLHEKGGVINFGPQLLPLSDCGGFGLAGRGEKIDLTHDKESMSLSYRCRCAAPSSRQLDWPNIQDSGFSGFWLEAKLQGDQNILNIECHIEGVRPLNQLAFSFFGQASSCRVARFQFLSPRSLDRYLGPPQPIVFGNVTLEVLQGIKTMEIIPLPGDDSFWGADFLAAFPLSQKNFSFRLRKN